jgi:hypothetical protein
VTVRGQPFRAAFRVRGTGRSGIVALALGAVLAGAACTLPQRPAALASPPLPAAKADTHAPLSGSDAAALRRAADAALARNPDPLAVAHVEGTLPTLPAYRRAQEARRDWGAMATLAAAYAIEDDPRYRDGYARYLAAWLDVYTISGNPIDESALGDWLLAYRAAGAALPPALGERMRVFACALADRYTQAQPPSRRTSTNNWQSHRVKIAVMGADVCADPARIARADAAFAAQITANLLPGGPSVDFAERDALHYVVYSLEPLLEAALFARDEGRTLYAVEGPQGRSLAGTLSWLEPYARGEKTHDEFVRSQVRFDAERAAAGVPGFAGPFEPRTAQWAYWLAAELDPRWHPTSARLGTPWVARRAAWLAPSAPPRRRRAGTRRANDFGYRGDCGAGVTPRMAPTCHPTKELRWPPT